MARKDEGRLVRKFFGRSPVEIPLENECYEPYCVIGRNRGVMSNKNYEVRRARVCSKPVPGGTFMQDLSFYLRPETMKYKLFLAKNYLSEKFSSYFGRVSRD